MAEKKHVEDGGNCWETLPVRTLLQASPWDAGRARGRPALTVSAFGKKNQVELDSLCDLMCVAPGGDWRHRPSGHAESVGASITFSVGAFFPNMPHKWPLTVLKHRRVCECL